MFPTFHSKHSDAPRNHRYAAWPWAAGGLFLLVLGLLRTLGLQQGSSTTRMVVLVLVLSLAVLSAFLVHWAGYSNYVVLVALLPIGLAFFLRVLCLDHITYDYQDFLSQWAAFFRDNGGFAAIKLPLGDYNAPYLYFMAAISYLPVPDLYMIKLFSILFDVILAWGGLRLAKTLCPAGSFRPLWAFCLLLLLPTVILNGAYWGQCDALYGALVLHAFASALTHRPKSSVILLAVAFSFKLQTVFLMPLWGILWLTRRVKFSHLWLFPLTYLVTILPALLLGKPLGAILGVYLGQATQYPGLTLNAPSIFALIPYQTQVNETLAAKLGIWAAFLLVLALLAVFYLLRDRVNDHTIFTGAVILAIGIPLLLPHMHDRYFFIADVLTLVWACLSPRRIPMAVGVQIASLGAYHAYLLLRYAFPMGWGTLLLMAVLFYSVSTLYRQLQSVPSIHTTEDEEKHKRM